MIFLGGLKERRKEGKMSRLSTIATLHKLVIHSHGATDEDYLKENKIIKTLNDYELDLICRDCFSLRSPMPKYPTKETFKYDVRYPAISKIREQK